MSATVPHTSLADFSRRVMALSVDISDAWCTEGISADTVDENGREVVNLGGVARTVLEALCGGDASLYDQYEGGQCDDSAAGRVVDILWGTRGRAPSAAVLATIVNLGQICMGWGALVRYRGRQGAALEKKVVPSAIIVLPTNGGKTFRTFSS